MAGEVLARHLLDIEHIDGQPAGRGHLRVFLAKGACRSIAWILKRFFIVQLLPRAQLKETLVRHIHLAAHLQIRDRTAEFFRHGADHAQIFRDVFAHEAIAPCGTAHEKAVPVFQGNGEAVKLRLHHIHGIVHLLAHTAIEIEELFLGKRIVQTLHRHFMRYRRKGVEG